MSRRSVTGRVLAKHSEGALLEADKRTESFLAQGNKSGHAVWLRIGKAVEELLRDDRDTDEPVH